MIKMLHRCSGCHPLPLHPRRKSPRSVPAFRLSARLSAAGPSRFCGHVEGELRAYTVVIAEGAQMDGEIVAEELTIGGHVKGSLHANRVQLNSTAVVEERYFPSNSRN